MTNPKNSESIHLLSPQRLPWLVGLGGFVFCLLTLSHWISLNSLGTVARVSGWLWRPEIGRPLTLVVFAPFRLLPEAWLPLVLNLATAFCAALVLGQLARSVAILRQDVVPADPMRKNQSGLSILTGPLGWIPPVFAALLCGLQRGFWEHATAASGEMLSLLCFAFALRCLLEFRLDSQQKWLSRCALFFAVGLTDNWLMVGYLPVLVAAIIWVKSYRSFLEWCFLLRMSCWALLGFSLYLVIPIWLCVTAPDQWDFWPTLKAQWVSQKQALQIFRLPAFRILAITALLPFLLLAVRWRSHTIQLADDSRFGVFFAKATGHFIHGLFFVTALWLVFTPAITPRQFEIKSPLLVYHYMWAMVAGYCVGYLLLFGAARGSRRAVKWPKFAAMTLLVLVPVGLVWKNFGDIHLTNGRALREFARQLYDDLPAGKSTVLSDELRPLLLLRAELAAHGLEKNPMLVDTRALPWPEYHRRMGNGFGARWPEVLLTNQMGLVGQAKLLTLVRQIKTNEPAVYLHPSSGLFVEGFVAEPHGWVQRLVDRSQTKTPAEDFSNTNELLWQQRWQEQLSARADRFEASRQREARWSQSSLKSLKFSSRTNETVVFLAGAYAKMLNHWGVQAQRRGQAGAADWFTRAVVFDPDNLAARINGESAKRRQSREKNWLTVAWVRENFPNLLRKYETWADVISRNGPVDDPVFLLHTGRMYLAGSNPYQALDSFQRSAELAPNWAAPKLWRAQCHNILGDFAQALSLTEGLPGSNMPTNGAALAQLLQIRAMALRQTGQTNEAIAYVEKFTSRYQNETAVLAVVADFYASAGQFLIELKWRDVLLQRDPNRVDWLVKKGHAELRQKEFEAAFNTLTRALSLAPADGKARLFRAIAGLQAGRLDDARRDYEELLKSEDHLQNALFGLGGVAWRAQDTNAMIQYYQSFLSNSATATPQAALANQRLKEWRDE